LRIICIAAVLLCANCAVRRPVTSNWRFLNQGTGQVLVPPDVANSALARRKLVTDVAAGEGRCPPGIRVKKKHVVATVARDALDRSPRGWLTSWATEAEASGCIAHGESPKLAMRVAEALPLDPLKAFQVLYPEDLVPPVRLQVVSPILRDESAPVVSEQQVSGDGNRLTLTLRADNLIGYETAVYGVQAKAAGAGYTIAPLYRDRHIDQTTERLAAPATNYFSFDGDRAFFRVFVKSGQTDYTALVIAASTRAELTRLATELADGTATCQTLGAKTCIAIPRRVALNAMVSVTINGAETLVRWGANAGEAVRGSGERNPETVLPTLTVSRLYGGHSVSVEFDHSDPAILRLPLFGGEVISWKR
jgi:hypothetical protein